MVFIGCPSFLVLPGIRRSSVAGATGRGLRLATRGDLAAVRRDGEPGAVGALAVRLPGGLVARELVQRPAVERELLAAVLAGQRADLGLLDALEHRRGPSRPHR